MQMHSSHPFFSVIIPTYNRAHVLVHTIDSVIGQKFDDFELIVVNDGSTDDTEKLFAQRRDKITLVNCKNNGPEEARNSGIRIAKGDYIAFLDSDDLLVPHALQIYHDVLTCTEAVLLIARGKGFRDVFDASGKENAPAAPEFAVAKDYLSKKNSVWLSTSFLVVKRELCLEQGTRFRKGTFPVDDTDFMLQSGVFGPCVLMNSPVTVGYRVHESNSIHDICKNLEKIDYLLRLEKEGAYPGGRGRKFDRLALIGGHIQNWVEKGFRAGYYYQSVRLLLKGVIALAAIAVKKAATLSTHLKYDTLPACRKGGCE